MGAERKTSKFSIGKIFSDEEPEKHLNQNKTENTELPSQHFSESDLQQEWEKLLTEVQQKDTLTYNAINAFRLSKKDEETVLIECPSEIAKSQFQKEEAEFFNHFKRKVNNYKIKVEYKFNQVLKREIETKKTLFEKMVEKNPLLKDLDELFKFDFS